MKNLTFKKLRKINLTRCINHFHTLESWSPLEWGGALAGECGEFCNFLKKIKRLDDKIKKINLDRIMRNPLLLLAKHLDRKDEKQIIKLEKERAKFVIAAGKEAGDVIAYLDLATARIGLELDGETIKKFNEVSDRKKCDIKL